jgi:hypothetical protein
MIFTEEARATKFPPLSSGQIYGTFPYPLSVFFALDEEAARLGLCENPVMLTVPNRTDGQRPITNLPIKFQPPINLHFLFILVFFLRIFGSRWLSDF